jgi:hypothetical protein
LYAYHYYRRWPTAERVRLAAIGEGPCAHGRAAAGLNEYLYGIAEDLEQLNALDVGQSALCTP